MIKKYSEVNKNNCYYWYLLQRNQLNQVDEIIKIKILIFIISFIDDAYTDFNVE